MVGGGAAARGINEGGGLKSIGRKSLLIMMALMLLKNVEGRTELLQARVHADLLRAVIGLSSLELAQRVTTGAGVVLPALT